MNWQTEEDPSKQLKRVTLFPLKVWDGFKVTEIDGVTKKGRIRVKISKYI